MELKDQASLMFVSFIFNIVQMNTPLILRYNYEFLINRFKFRKFRKFHNLKTMKINKHPDLFRGPFEIGRLVPT